VLADTIAAFNVATAEEVRRHRAVERQQQEAALEAVEAS
jgi:hypothetical protein